MKKIFLLILISSSCLFASHRENFMGNWQMNVEKYKERLDYNNALKDPKRKDTALKLIDILKTMTLRVDKTSLTFTNTNPADGKEIVKSKTYKIKKGTEVGFTILFKGDKYETSVQFIDKNNFSFYSLNPLDQSGILYFTRIKNGQKASK